MKILEHPDVHGSLETSKLSVVELKCITQGRIQMHHLGRRFSKWIWVVVARVK